VDALHIHGDAARDDSELVEKAIWSRLGTGHEPPACLGRTREGQRTEPLAITQLLLLYHLLDASRLLPALALSRWHEGQAELVGVFGGPQR
jgi:phosphoribulokinase